MGHVMRCVAISQMLKGEFELGFAIFMPDKQVKEAISAAGLKVLELKSQFDIQHAHGYDAVVLDGYWFDNTYVKQLKKLRKKVIQIDDLAGNEFFSDVVINHAVGADYSTSVFHNQTRLLTGSKYALLREEFLYTHHTASVKDNLESLTISMGGADPHNYTLKLLMAITHTVHKTTSINLLIGTAFSQLNELKAFTKNHSNLAIHVKQSLNASEIIDLIKNTSMFICSASTVVYEALAVRVPVACFVTADNQQGIYKGLVLANCVLGMGDITVKPENTLKATMQEAFTNYSLARSYVKNQELLIDGRSGERIKEITRSLWN